MLKTKPIYIILVLCLIFICSCDGRTEHLATNTPPTVNISDPVDGGIFGAGSAITFKGSALDPEEGELAEESLEWTSNLDGQLGKGGLFVRNSLSVGTHIITLKAIDSEDSPGSATISITIKENTTALEIPIVGVWHAQQISEDSQEQDLYFELTAQNDLIISILAKDGFLVDKYETQYQWLPEAGLLTFTLKSQSTPQTMLVTYYDNGNKAIFQDQSGNKIDFERVEKIIK